jgi:ribosome maturation factor RimP
VLRLYIDKSAGYLPVGDEPASDLDENEARAEEQAQGITLDDCTRVSRQVSGVLDVEDPIEGEYSLEVSSPGDDRPLFRVEHYERFVGYKVRARLTVPVDGRRGVTGHIVGIEDGKIVIEEDGEQWQLAMDQIATARLVPDA